MEKTTLLEIFNNRVERGGDSPALRRLRGSQWEVVSWNEWRLFSHRVAGGLLSLGLKEGDKVAILSNTRIEWV